MKASMIFSLGLTNNTILSCFSFCFLIIDSCFLISPVVAQFFNSIAELVIPIRISTKVVEIETYPVTAEAKFSIKFPAVQTFSASYSLNHFGLLLQ